MNAHKGNESTAHLQAKETLVSGYNNDAWMAFPECGNADVAVMHLDSGFLAAIEFETSPKHVLNNIMRDFSRGCEAVAVVTLNPKLHNQIRNKVQRRFPDSEIFIQVFPYDRQGLLDLRYWFLSRAAAKAGKEES